MSAFSPKNRISAHTVLTLFRHELRILCQNRMACAVIFLMILVAGLAAYGQNRQPNPIRETCYVVYWQENDWIRELKTAARHSAVRQHLRIEVVPVTQFTDADGIIRYPPGCHSIQLRPVEPSRDNRQGWLVWYWYAGSDPAALFPYAHWFQKVTHEFFHEGIRWQEQVSPLSPQLALFGQFRDLGIHTFLGSERIGYVLVWMCLFFSAGHLSKLSLAQAVCERSIHSLVVTPAGWDGPIIAIRFFYGLLAMSLAAVATALLKPDVLPSVDFWMVILCATLIYLGVGLTIAAFCKSVASAGLGTSLYLMGAGVLYALATQWPVLSETAFSGFVSAEAALFSSFDALWSSGGPASGPVAPLPLMFWALVWTIISEFSLRQVKQK